MQHPDNTQQFVCRKAGMVDLFCCRPPHSADREPSLLARGTTVTTPPRNHFRRIHLGSVVRAVTFLGNQLCRIGWHKGISKLPQPIQVSRTGSRGFARLPQTDGNRAHSQLSSKLSLSQSKLSTKLPYVYHFLIWSRHALPSINLMRSHTGTL